MSTKTNSFTLFGRVYRSRQFAAIPALVLLEKKGDIHPLEMLIQTDVHDGVDWRALDSTKTVNEYVFDAAEAVLPVKALSALTTIVSEYNFGFLKTWKGVRVPSRFCDPAQTASSENVDPLVAQLIGDGAANMQQLEEYYSLQDAFKMFDVIVARGVNQALANEAAMKNSK